MYYVPWIANTILQSCNNLYTKSRPLHCEVHSRNACFLPILLQSKIDFLKLVFLFNLSTISNIIGSCWSGMRMKFSSNIIQQFSNPFLMTFICTRSCSLETVFFCESCFFDSIRFRVSRADSPTWSYANRIGFSECTGFLGIPNRDRDWSMSRFVEFWSVLHDLESLVECFSAEHVKSDHLCWLNCRLVWTVIYRLSRLAV